MEAFIVLTSILDGHRIKLFIIQIVCVEGVAHEAGHEGAQTHLEREGDSSHVQQLSLPIVINACQEGLVDEEVSEQSESGDSPREQLLSLQSDSFFVILVPPLLVLPSEAEEALDYLQSVFLARFLG